jgi:hypothetical protein
LDGNASIYSTGGPGGAWIYRTDGKAVALSAGLDGATFKYDNSGSFYIISQPRADLNAQNGNNHTVELQINSSGTIFNEAYNDRDFSIRKITSGNAFFYDSGSDILNLNANAMIITGGTSVTITAPANGSLLTNAPTGAVSLAIATTGYADGLMTTHEGTYTHTDIALNTAHRGDDALHRIINDSGTSSTELWSANKIDAEISAIQSGYNRRQAVIDLVDNTAAPPTEVIGDRYIIDNTGASHVDWDGAAGNDIVQFNGTAWVAETPDEGWVAYVDAQNKDALFVDDGTPEWELRPTIPVNHADLGLLGADDHTQYHNDARALTWLGTRSTTDLLEGSNLYYTEGRVSANADVAANTTHRTSDGTDHTYINQDLRTTATVSFGGLVLGATTTVNAIYDDDTLSPDSNTALATQQSIKAYVDGLSQGFTQGSVLFAASDGTITEDNADFNWNNTTKTLHVTGSATPVITVQTTASGPGNSATLFLADTNDGWGGKVQYDTGTGYLELIQRNGSADRTQLSIRYGSVEVNADALDVDFTVHKLTSGQALSYNAGSDTLNLDASTITLSSPADGAVLTNHPTGGDVLAIATWQTVDDVLQKLNLSTDNAVPKWNTGTGEYVESGVLVTTGVSGGSSIIKHIYTARPSKGSMIEGENFFLSDPVTGKYYNCLFDGTDVRVNEMTVLY